MKQLTSALAKNSFLRSVSALTGGTAVSQSITVVALPILTRLYTPEDFGVFGVYAAILSLFAVVAALRYELAIPLARTKGAAANVLALACLCVLGMTILTALFIFFLDDRLVMLTNTPMLAPYLWLIPIGVALSGWYQCFSYWAVRHKAFSHIVTTRVAQSISSVATQISLGWTGFGALSLIVGNIIGQSVGLLGLARYVLLEGRAIFRFVRKRRIEILARRFIRFPQYSMLEGLTNSASIEVPLLLLAALFLPWHVGLFLLAMRVLQIPIGLIGGAVGQVYFSHAVDALRNGELDELTSRVFRGLVLVGLAPLILICIAAPDLFAFVFGDQWRIAGEYARWMTPWLFAQFIFSPISVLTTVTEHQAGGFHAQLIFLATRIVFLLLGSATGSPDVAIAAYAISSAVVYCGYGAWLLHLANLRLRAWLPFLLGNIVSWCLVLALVYHVIAYIFPSPF